MAEAQEFIADLRRHHISFFAGVPDSLLQPLCAVLEGLPPSQHVIAANEGNAVAMAAGHFLATGGPGAVYFQNSGLGNAVNPLMSLADPEVYAIPMLLVIGWRGQPGVKDEPQHAKQGRVTQAMLEAMEIPAWVLDKDADAHQLVDKACQAMAGRHGPVALVVAKGAFGPSRAVERWEHYALRREDALRHVVGLLPQGALVVSTTGHISRELYEYREATGEPGADFLTVGSMGHASSIALGVATDWPDRLVACLDGDGAALMHMGAMAVIGQHRPKNLLHVVLNNGAHDSVGGQPTAGFSCDLTKIALACGYATAEEAQTVRGIDLALEKILAGPGPAFLEIRICRGARKDLGRPKTSPIHNRDAFMAALSARQGE